MSNVKIALRIRPLISSEATLDHQLAVHIDANNIVNLHNPGISQTNVEYRWDDTKASSQPRQFAFDFCFPLTDGSCVSAKIASQEKVFKELGMPLLDSLFEGYNACVLAYGQSGTGKTYTMMGTALEPGLAPRLCTTIFDRIKAESDCSNIHRPSFRIDISFMEIYNEKVRDLLEQQSPRRDVQLKIREHPISGPYVQGLSRHTVRDAAAALALLKEGVQCRSSAATHKNGYSSRSHAVFTVHCTASWVTSEGGERETVAKLHLVDLAGSERANCHPISRLRLKEGSLINKSLTSLGNVINALAEKSSHSMSSISTLNTSCSSTSSNKTESVQTIPSTSPRHSRTTFIPYRDSVLTWLLKDSLGGNSKTFLVAAISPSTLAFKETLNTLRFAQRAKHVVNEPVVNENANVKLIHHLKEEVTRLRALFAHSVEVGQSNDNSRLVSSENIANSFSDNHSKTYELTEDWLRKGRCRETGEATTTIHSTPRSTEIGIQTSFPIIVADPEDLIPIKESHLVNRSRMESAKRELGTTLSDSETGCWSDDSLDGSYPTEFRPTTESYTESPRTKLKLQETASIIKPNFQIGERLSALLPASGPQRRQSPIPSSKKRINARKVIRTSPGVRMMFKKPEEVQKIRCSSPLSQPRFSFDQPSGSFSGQEAFPCIPDQGCHSSSTVSALKLQFDHLQLNQDQDNAMVRSNSQSEKMTKSGALESYQESDLVNHIHSVPSPRIGLSSLKSSLDCKMICCCYSRRHCKDGQLKNQNLLAQITPQCNTYCRRDTSYQGTGSLTSKSQSFDTIIRAELLAIRRRMVARTASPKVAASLRYLSQWQVDPLTKPLSLNSKLRNSLPDEVWV